MNLIGICLEQTKEADKIELVNYMGRPKLCFKLAVHLFNMSFRWLSRSNLFVDNSSTVAEVGNYATSKICYSWYSKLIIIYLCQVTCWYRYSKRTKSEIKEFQEGHLKKIYPRTRKVILELENDSYSRSQVNIYYLVTRKIERKSVIKKLRPTYSRI